MLNAQKSKITCFINEATHDKPFQASGHYSHFIQAGDEVEEQKLYFQSTKNKYSVLKSNGVKDELHASFMERFNYLEKYFKNTSVTLHAVNLKEQYEDRGKMPKKNDYYTTKRYARRANSAAIIAFDTKVVFIEVHSGIIVQQFFGDQIEHVKKQKSFRENCADMQVDIPALNGSEVVNFHGNTKVNLDIKSKISMDLQAGDSVKTITSRYNVGVNTVYDIRRDHNITASPKDRRNAKIKQLLQSGISVTNIAKKLELSRGTVNSQKNILKATGEL
ncbi:hypothetical protein [Psychromonas aquimarina]|uniref:hypothetical protein n=1 Tax=Psychromonas aquimarina TaxID=444919 RepID=UPI00040949DA|nr:hypothetical protein [Psychromonas aquimarina]